MLTLRTTMVVQEYPVLYQLFCCDKGPALETSAAWHGAVHVGG